MEPTLSHRSRDLPQSFDVTIWMGDLNYRVNRTRDEALAVRDAGLQNWGEFSHAIWHSSSPMTISQPCSCTIS
jgi:hypothetical protein